MTKLADASTVTGSHTLNAVFDHVEDARAAVLALERAGMPPDRVGLVTENIRQAREVAGSYSPQGAIIGAIVGILLMAGYVVFGGEQMRNPLAIAMGGFAIVGGLTAIGWLAGRARLFKQDRYEHFEDESAMGEILVSVVCDTPEGADTTRAMLERGGAREVRVEESGESV
jgi:hypothetical protein